MKYVFYETLKVLSFNVSSNELSYVDEAKNLIFRNQIITNNTSDSGYLLADKYFFYSNEDDYKTYLFDIETNVKQGLGYVGYPSERCFDGEIFVTYEYLDLIEFKQRLIYYNIKKNEKKVIKSDLGISLLYNNKVIATEYSKLLKSLSLITGEYEWETPINRSGEIFKILGVRDNELVVCWKRGWKLFGLLGIDIQTGVIVWNIDNNQLLNGHSLYFTDNQQSLFSAQGTNHNSYFIEIDLLSKQAIRLGEIEDLCKAQVEISRSQYKDGLIYFTASTHHDIFPDIIGVLDYKTLKILWQHRFDFDRLTHLKNFEVSEDKLYVLDSKDTLHIFEREAE